MPLTALAFLLVYVVGVGTALLYPLAGIVVYILVYHINPETQWWGSSVAFLGPRMSLIVAIATLTGMLVRWPKLEHGARQFAGPYVLGLLLLAVAAGSLLWGLGIGERGLYQLEKFAKILIFVFILIRCVRTPLEYHAVVVAWLVGVFYIGYQALGGAGVVIRGRLNEGIGGPDFAESSDLAVHLVATLPWIGALFFMARTWLGRGALLVVGALTVNTLIMTRTRNALVGLALVTLGCVLALPRGYRVRGVAAVIAGSLLAVQLTDPGWWSRMATIAEYETDPSALGRLDYWRAALAMVRDHPLGIGIGNFHSAVRDYIPGLTEERGCHSTPLACLAELGYFGLGVFTLVVVVALARLGRVRRAAQRLPQMIDLSWWRIRTRFHLGWHAIALRAGLLGYLGCGLFTTRTFSENYWLMVGLSVCLWNASKYMAATAGAAELQPRATAGPAELPSHPGAPAMVREPCAAAASPLCPPVQSHART